MHSHLYDDRHAEWDAMDREIENGVSGIQIRTTQVRF